MVVFPNAKINLGLNITSKRNDGFHNLSSCFYPIPIYDLLEIVPSSKFEFHSTGIKIPDDDASNLCVKAYELLTKEYKLPPVKIHLHKNIPIGAGLGGGSADASFVLKTLNELYKLQLSTNQLQSYANKLGSDCPFFIENKTVIAEGTGDIFTKIALDLSNYYLVLLNPSIHISTAEAFNKITPNTPRKSISDSLRSPIDTWQNNLINDFEAGIFEQHPIVKELKISMLDQGAIYASMTGTGSSVFGIFEDLPQLGTLLTQYLIWQGKLSN